MVFKPQDSKLQVNLIKGQGKKKYYRIYVNNPRTLILGEEIKKK